MLFKAGFEPLIAGGKITETWRAWTRPQAKVGSVHRIGSGLIEVDAVDRVPLGTADAKAAAASGFDDVEAMLAELQRGRPALGPTDSVFRIRFHYLGPDERPRPGDDADLTAEVIRVIDDRLARFDARSPRGPWTRATLGLIDAHPGVRAGDLAQMLGWERLAFKALVRKLKGLGLTESLEVGYRLSPRGRAYVAATRGLRR